jgi:hypothetical protein
MRLSEQSTSPATAPEVGAFCAAIAQSPIILGVPEIAPHTLEARLADWERTRNASDIDAVILAWIASHARGRKSRLLS